MDFKNIREIHVLEPWYHLNKLEQIVGRGIRFCSHSGLDPQKRNVTVYLHTVLCEEMKQYIIIIIVEVNVNLLKSEKLNLF